MALDFINKALPGTSLPTPLQYIGLWLLPANRATFLKQCEQSCSNLPLNYEEVIVPPKCKNRCFRLFCAYICWPPGTVISKGTSVLKEFFLGKQGGNKKVLLGALKISEDKFNSLVHRPSRIILLVIVFEAQINVNTKLKRQVRTGSRCLGLLHCMEMWSEAGFRQGPSCCQTVVFLFALFCVTSFWASKSLVAKSCKCLLIAIAKRTEKLHQ